MTADTKVVTAVCQREDCPRMGAPYRVGIV